MSAPLHRNRFPVRLLAQSSATIRSSREVSSLPRTSTAPHYIILDGDWFTTPCGDSRRRLGRDIRALRRSGVEWAAARHASIFHARHSLNEELRYRLIRILPTPTSWQLSSPRTRHERMSSPVQNHRTRNRQFPQSSRASVDRGEDGRSIRVVRIRVRGLNRRIRLFLRRTDAGTRAVRGPSQPQGPDSASERTLLTTNRNGESPP